MVRPGARVASSPNPAFKGARQGNVSVLLDRWIARIFEPDRLEETCRQLAEAQASTVEDEARLATARQGLAECDRQVAKYRDALDAGADAAVVATWIKEVQAERRRLESEHRRDGPAAIWSAEDVRRLVDSLGDVTRVLRRAERRKKAGVYESLGLGVAYELDERKVRVEADLTRGDKVRVGGEI